MKQVFVALGSNLGDRREQIQKALQVLQGTAGISRVKMSRLYETDPVGGPAGQGKYLNGVIQFETDLSPQELLEHLLVIEKSLGRERSVKNAPRTIDLDLLFYGDNIIRDVRNGRDRSLRLEVPHPRLHERTFVLRPLADLAPDLMHPVLKKTVKQMWIDLGRERS